jgi:electron transfer flavoprotein alpha subunit
VTNFLSEKRKVDAMADRKGILIYGELIDGKLASITKELLGCGSRLCASLGEKVYVVLIGTKTTQAAEESVAFGADHVYVIDDQLSKAYQTEFSVSSMIKVVEQVRPRFLIIGHTSVGQDLAPRLAFRLNTAAVLDCVELSIDPDSKLLLQTKPVYGGKAWATFVCESSPQLATVRPKSMIPLEKDNSRKGVVTPINIDLDKSLIRARLVERIVEKREGITLEDAEIVICGGRGIGGIAGFQQLEELAKLLKGAVVGATRAACDAGWAPSTIQIGLTGKIVTPKVYMATALSGASQHMAGCSGSETIVAINKDAGANIFKEAKFGVVGDWKILLPTFIKQIVEISKE